MDAFRMMCGSYHEPVRLIHRSFREATGTAACRNTDGQVGGRCSTTNPELHRGCRAMECLRDHKTAFQYSDKGGVRGDSFGVSVEGCDDDFTAFTNGVNAFMENIAAAQKE